MLARCDVKFKNTADNKTIYTDFRKVLERKDIDVVAIATHPGWHALISIAAMEAGKDVLCEKPMCRFIAEGRAVAEAEKRYNRIFQIGTYGRFRRNPQDAQDLRERPVESSATPYWSAWRGQGKGLERHGEVQGRACARKPRLGHVLRPGSAAALPTLIASAAATAATGTMKAAAWATWPTITWMGLATNTAATSLPRSKSRLTPPPMHPECCMVWGWCELKYADGFTLVFESGEWGQEYAGLQAKNTGEGDIRKMLERGRPEETRCHARSPAVAGLRGMRSVSANRPAATLLLHIGWPRSTTS